MRNSSKILLGFMLVMMICCVSAVSATDINGTDDAIITDDIAIDDVSEIVEDVEIDDASDDVVEEENLRYVTPTINGNSDISQFFDNNGYLLNTASNNLNFAGDFNKISNSFGNFKINRAITLNVAGASFNDIGFDLLYVDGITLSGATFIINAPDGEDCFAINSVFTTNSVISNNVITYTCNHANPTNYNYVIRVAGGDNVSVSNNNITAYLPLKKVDYNQTYPSIFTDLVAGVAVQSSSNFRFTNNRLLVNVSLNEAVNPTLDALIIVNSVKAYIGNNTIVEIDPVTGAGTPNYLYAVDVYTCDNITIDRNNIKLESRGGSIIPGTNNGTGAAYGIQLTGGHTGVTISNNVINTSNNGPNMGIYSQNYNGYTSLNITGNTIYVEGNASSDHSWSLVTGMELGDDYVYVAGNNITVKNKATFHTGDNVYGISYSQGTLRNHEQHILGNNVTVINGEYAVYMMDSFTGSEAKNNCLETTYACGDDAVWDNEVIKIKDNYCPNCDCSNCTCH